LGDRSRDMTAHVGSSVALGDRSRDMTAHVGSSVALGDRSRDMTAHVGSSVAPFFVAADRGSASEELTFPHSVPAARSWIRNRSRPHAGSHPPPLQFRATPEDLRRATGHLRNLPARRTGRRSHLAGRLRVHERAGVVAFSWPSVPAVSPGGTCFLSWACDDARVGTAARLSADSSVLASQGRRRWPLPDGRGSDPNGRRTGDARWGDDGAPPGLTAWARPSLSSRPRFSVSQSRNPAAIKPPMNLSAIFFGRVQKSASKRASRCHGRNSV
jgi:hypothetical protein